ncbi:MAG: trk/ktr system potassium uptake protein [Eubacteriales bacterium]|nr:trk/ktr system potassium uptake protein [Eubacteriales bacterium]
MLFPLAVAIIAREWNAALDFLIGFCACLLAGFFLVLICARGKRPISWTHGMVVASFSWIIGMLLAAIPYYLSGHYLSYLDACFDVMSGFTTTGLTLIQDLDHAGYALNMWRHVLTYLGGQGMVVFALTFLMNDAGGAFKIYVGEAKDEKLLPNVRNTARAIWFISVVYLLVGTLIFTLVALGEGIKMPRAFLHGLWLFMGGWSTGGFAPMSQNILYYHSLLIELFTIIFFTVGSFNFALHYAVWSGDRQELRKNVEIISFTVTLILLTLLTTAGFMKAKIYPDWMAVFRKGFYHLISGHTTTGFMTVYARQFINDWGELALLALIIAMLIGGSASSTAGGFKGLRMGILFHALREDVRRLIRPETSVLVEKFHHLREVVLGERHVRMALMIIVLYVFMFAVGTVGGLLAGYPLLEAMFEAASVTGNVGLSAGVTTPATPWGLKVLYIIMMWLARLEFMSVFAMFAYIAAGLKNR